MIRLYILHMFQMFWVSPGNPESNQLEVPQTPAEKAMQLATSSWIRWIVGHRKGPKGASYGDVVATEAIGYVNIAIEHGAYV